MGKKYAWYLYRCELGSVFGTKQDHMILWWKSKLSPCKELNSKTLWTGRGILTRAASDGPKHNVPDVFYWIYIRRVWRLRERHHSFINSLHSLASWGQALPCTRRKPGPTVRSNTRCNDFFPLPSGSQGAVACPVEVWASLHGYGSCGIEQKYFISTI